jgi:hypothetical protein
MRVRITKELAGSIDGIQLARLFKGQVYDVATSLACYLLSEGMAEPASNEKPTAVLPIESQIGEQSAETRGKGLNLPRSLAADRTRTGAGTNKKKKES